MSFAPPSKTRVMGQEIVTTPEGPGKGPIRADPVQHMRQEKDALLIHSQIPESSAFAPSRRYSHRRVFTSFILLFLGS